MKAEKARGIPNDGNRQRFNGKSKRHPSKIIMQGLFSMTTAFTPTFGLANHSYAEPRGIDRIDAELVHSQSKGQGVKLIE
ncbi:hypothetical protein ACFLT4_01830 [Chloroflexota bacterium]